MVRNNTDIELVSSGWLEGMVFMKKMQTFGMIYVEQIF